MTVIDFPTRPSPPPPSIGNGALEALKNVLGSPIDDYLTEADWVIIGLWVRGYKIVPLEASDLG